MTPGMTQTAGASVTEEQVAFYREIGYLIVPNLLTDDDLVSIRAAVDEAYSYRVEGHDGTGRNAAYDGTFLQKINLWQVSEGIRRHTFNPKLANIAARLSGKPVRLWHDQALVKRPGDAAATPYHQDLVYWPMMEADSLTAWTALDDVTVHNGCLHFIPGSHRWEIGPWLELVGGDDLDQHLPARAAGVTPVAAEIPAGSVTFHHCLTFHGATPNHTDRPRRAMIVHYMTDGTRFNGQEHCVSDVKGLKAGEPMVDDGLWPIVSEV